MGQTDAYMNDTSFEKDRMSLLERPLKITGREHGWLGEMQVSAALVTAENIWFVSGLLNCLCQYDIEEQRITVVAEFTEDQANSYLSGYCKLLEYGEWIWLLPGTASRIVKYHKTDSRLVFLDIPNTSKCEPGKLNFYSAVVRDEEIWLLPYLGEQILCINMGNDAVKSIEIPEGKKLQLMAGTLCGNRIFSFGEGSGRLVTIDCDSHDIKECLVADDGARFAAMQYDEKKHVLWLFASNMARVYKIYPESLQMDIIPLKGIYGKEMEDFNYNTAFWDGKIWITSRNEKPFIWEFDTEKQEIKSHDYYTGHAQLLPTIKFLGADGAIELSHDGQELFFFPGQFEKFLILKKNGRRVYGEFKLDKEKARVLLIKTLKHFRGNTADMYKDLYWCTLPEFIGLVNERKRELYMKQVQSYDKVDENCGGKIFNYLLKEV